MTGGDPESPPAPDADAARYASFRRRVVGDDPVAVTVGPGGLIRTVLVEPMLNNVEEPNG